MNRNKNIFAYNQVWLDMPRSRFPRYNDHKTTMNASYLYPIYIEETLPGDTVKMEMSQLVREMTPIFPVMDQAYIDIMFFHVPNRLIWDHWKEFMGENRTSYWAQEQEYKIPTIKNMQDGGWKKGSIADLMGINPGKNKEVMVLPFRAYTLIYNEWWRDENNVEPAHLYTDDTDRVISGEVAEANEAEFGMTPRKVAKLADYFTTALPQAQKGDPVLLPLGTMVPVITGETREIEADTTPMTEADATTGNVLTSGIWFNHTAGEVRAGNLTSGAISGSVGKPVPTNLWADLSEAEAANVNQLRMAFQVQKLLERDAIGGTRYTEIVRSHFGVISPDARQQRPEFLGGKRIPINMTQVVQQSSTDDTSPQGNTAAYSLTVDRSDYFTSSFTEHGWIIGVACIRTNHTYQQGLQRFWGRRTRYDYYWPELANIGNQFIRNEEIYMQGTDEDEEAFGYQEAWAEYRYSPNRISGELRSSYAQSLDAWHYGDDFDSLPVLSKAFIEETDANIARTLAVQTQDQFKADFYFKTEWTRPMPVNSVPGLIDHH